MLDMNLANKDLATHVYEQLLVRLVNLELRPGQHVVEAKLAEELGVSKTPVRSAMERLVAQGMLCRHNRRGCFVPTHSPSELCQVYEAREAIEGMAARLMAMREDEDQLHMLRQLQSEFRTALRQHSDGARVLVLDIHFHWQIIRSCGNVFISEFVNAHALTVKAFTHYSLGMPILQPDTDFTHEHITAAIEAHDPDAAEAIARGHVRHSKARLQRWMEQRENVALGTPNVLGI